MLAERDAAILRLFQAKTLVTARIEPEAGSSPAARNPSLGPVVAMQRNELSSGVGVSIGGAGVPGGTR